MGFILSLPGFLLGVRRGPAPAARLTAAATHAEALDSRTPNSQSDEIGVAYYLLGDFERARVSCEKRPEFDNNQICLAVTYDKLGRHAEAQEELAKLKAVFGDTAAYQYAFIHAQWGDHAKALEWLDTAMHLRDTGLSNLKTDPLMDPLRNEPRFQAIQRALRFPD